MVYPVTNLGIRFYDNNHKKSTLAIGILTKICVLEK